MDQTFAKKKIISPSIIVRLIFCGLVFFITLILLYFAGLRLISGLNSLYADRCVEKGELSLAADHLDKAVRYVPHDFQTLKELGRVWFDLGVSEKSAVKQLPFIIKARESFFKAVQLNSLDAESAYRLAQSEARLERLYSVLFPDMKCPYQSLEWYRKAIMLRPNSISFRYDMVRVLAARKDPEMLIVVHKLSQIFPPVYYHLKKEPFWSDEVKEVVKKGLEQAIERETSLRETHKALSSLMTLNEQWEEAASYYESSLRHKSSQNTPWDFIHLGVLHMKNQAMKEAEFYFIRGLYKSGSKEDALKQIFNIYKRAGALEAFSLFYDRVRRAFVTTSAMDILLARSLFEQEDYVSARDLFLEANKKGPSAEAFYWLARIAEKARDWDMMELDIQKATVLEPGNSNFHYYFSRSLRQQKKYEGAEKEAGLAIQFSTKPNEWYYNYRAANRKSLKDNAGALDDWQEAIKLRPDYAPFYSEAGEACLMLADWSRAIDYYEKAISLDPEKKAYQERYDALKKSGL